MAYTDSLAATFFASLSADDSQAFTQLSELVAPNSSFRESEWMEYKSGHYNDPDDIAPEWSKQLSGFANAGDGIVIWGIRTKAFNKFDVPDSIVLVKDPQRLAGELERLKSQAVEPPVHGVKIRVIANARNEGFVVAFIPESTRRPHQVKLNNVAVQDRYYIRNGHATEPIRQSLLRILFYPQFSPLLNLTFMLRSKTEELVTVDLYLRNTGPISVSELDVVATDQGSEVYFVPNKLDVTEYRRVREAIGVLANRTLHPEFSICLGMTVFRPDRHFMINAFGKDMKPFRWKVIRSEDGTYEIKDFP